MKEGRKEGTSIIHSTFTEERGGEQKVSAARSFQVQYRAVDTGICHSLLSLRNASLGCASPATATATALRSPRPNSNVGVILDARQSEVGTLPLPLGGTDEGSRSD